MSKCEDDTKYDRSILWGVTAIAKYMGCSKGTIYRWVRTQGFPAGKMPRGLWAVSTQAIDDWIAIRNPYRYKSEKQVV